MKYRKLGKTGIKVSVIGFGTWGIGGKTDDGAHSYGITDDRESIRALSCAFDLGINFYDTSNIYGYGHAEELLGETFKKYRDRVVIASKVGFVRHGGHHNISPSYIRQCLEQSLRRLQTDYLDLYQLHSPPVEILESTPETILELQKMKKEGKIRSFGFSVKQPKDGLVAIKQYGFETVQTNFNMIDERALECGLFNVAEQQGAGIIVRTPLAFGFLTGKVASLSFDSSDHRSSWPEGQLKRWAKALDFFSFIKREKNKTPAQLAIQFCLGFYGVSTVIPGMLHPHEVEENAKVNDLPLLDKEDFATIKAVYNSEEFFDSSLKKV